MYNWCQELNPRFLNITWYRIGLNSLNNQKCRPFNRLFIQYGATGYMYRNVPLLTNHYLWSFHASPQLTYTSHHYSSRYIELGYDVYVFCADDLPLNLGILIRFKLKQHT